MAVPRHQLVDPTTPGYYHCITRCVRRAFLCGLDPLSGRSFDHRKSWIESRLIELAEIFGVGLYAYAVMSNHVHAVVHVDPGTAAGWPDSEVAERWVRLFPASANGEPDPEGCLRRRDAILGNPDRLAQCRLRLRSLSWFMRCLAEPIARRANREDGCTGRFWEGRFKCQALLDDAAVLSCMSYVDLNPVRAGIAPDLPSSTHTSVKRRIETTSPPARGEPLRAIAGSIIEPTLPVALVECLALVDWTDRTTRPDKRGAIRSDAPPVLARIGLRPRQWQVQVLGTESRYWRDRSGQSTAGEGRRDRATLAQGYRHDARVAGSTGRGGRLVAGGLVAARRTCLSRSRQATLTRRAAAGPQQSTKPRHAKAVAVGGLS